MRFLGTIGSVPSKGTNVQNLAMLVSSEADFAAAFDNSVAIEIAVAPRVNGSESSANKSCILT